MSQEKILIVDDDSDLLSMMELVLAKADLCPVGVDSGKACLEYLETELPDLILLDIMMPEMNGLEVLQTIRGQVATKHIPVILHSSLGEDDVVVKALELGGDDYITKISGPRIKISRIKAALRRKAPPPDPESAIILGEIELYPDAKKVVIKGNSVKLSDTECSVLRLLVTQSGILHTIEQILASIRGEAGSLNRDDLSQTVYRLSKKLGSSGNRIEKILGVGYRMRE